MHDAGTTRQHYRLTLAALAAAALSYSLLQTMVVPALPDVQRQLGVSTTSVTWVMTVFLLTTSIFTPIFGRLGDMFGKERMLIVVMGLFILGTVACGLAHSLALLVGGRAIQGTAGAVFPLAVGIIRDEFPREKVASGIGLISATYGVGGGAALVLAGVIVQHLSWEWLFWLSLLLTVPATAAIVLFVPESPVKTPSSINWSGAALLSLGLTLLLFGVSEASDWGWGSARVLGLMAAGALLLAAWVGNERRAPEPLVDMRMMRLRGVWTTNLVAVLVGFGMYSSFILVPQLVASPPRAGVGFGASVSASALFLLPATMVMLLGGPIAGALGSRVGSKVPLLAGCALCGAGFGGIALWHDAHWQIYAGTAVFGLGIAFAFAAMATLVVEAVPQHQTGVASGINTIARTIGGAFGAQLVATVIAGSVAARTGLPTDAGFTAAFALAAAAMVAGLLVGVAVPRRAARDAQATRARGGEALAPADAA
jgi:EmrB/QacA subfamily drug resistance transporter